MKKEFNKGLGKAEKQLMESFKSELPDIIGDSVYCGEGARGAVVKNSDNTVTKLLYKKAGLADSQTQANLFQHEVEVLKRIGGKKI